MKCVKTFLIITIVFTTNIIFAQSALEKWPSMAVFREVLSLAFHAAEQGNLAAIKAHSEEVMEKAIALLKFDIPEEYRTKSILSLAEKLQLQSKNLHKLIVSNASDTIILKSFTDLHETFHQIIGQCSEVKK